MEAAQLQALRHLTAYLVHPNVQLMAYSYVTLKELLTEGGAAARLYDELDDVTKAYLRTFQSTKRSRPPFGLQPLPQLETTEELFNGTEPPGLSYAAWVSRVCYGLALSGRCDPFFRACAPVCYLQVRAPEWSSVVVFLLFMLQHAYFSSSNLSLWS